MLKNLLRFIFLITIGYFFVTGMVFLFQKSLIYQSESLDKEYLFQFENQFKEVNIPGTGGELLNTLIFTPDSDLSQGILLYFHGNADNLQRWGEYSIDFTRLGYTVIMIDYSGYGKSTGIASEEMLYQNAEDTWQWVEKNYPDQKKIIYGRSLGAAVASNLATKHKAEQLILETPFYEILQHHLKPFFPYGLKCEYPNYQYIPKVDYPITIIQGTNDCVVSINSAKKLGSLLKPEDRFIVIDRGGHKNLREFQEYNTELGKLLK